MIAATTRIGCSSKRVTNCLRSAGIVVMLMKSAKISAPIRIVKSIAVVRPALDQRGVQRLPGERAPPEREHHGAKRAHAGALGGGKEAPGNSAHHEQEQHRHRPDAAERYAALAPA